MASTTLSLFLDSMFIEYDDSELQPLDLSLCSNRHEQTTRQENVRGNGPFCLAKTCACCIDNTHSHCLSPYPTVMKVATRTTYPRRPSPVDVIDSSLHHQTQNPTSKRLTSNAPTKLMHPPSSSPLASTGTENASLNQSPPVSTYHNSRESFHTYNTNDDFCKNSISCAEIKNTEPAHSEISHVETRKDLLESSSLQKEDDNEGLTYMDLDSSSITSFQTEVINRCPKSLPYKFKRFLYNKSIEEERNTKKAFLSKTSHGCDSSETLKETSYVGDAPCLIYRENGQNKVLPPVKVSSASEPATQKHQHKKQVLKHQQRDLFVQNSSPTPGHKFSSMSDHRTSSNLHSRYPSENESTSVDKFLLQQPSENNSSDKVNRMGRSNKTQQFTSMIPNNTIPDPSAKDPVGAVSNSINSASQSSSESETTRSSAKMSCLDSLISKILKEIPDESPRPNEPFAPQYVFTPSGEKKIRIRLVDLIDLQVEQSLNA